MKIRSLSGLALLAPICCGQGVITTVAGTDFIFPDDGKPAIEARLAGPRVMALDSRGAVYFVAGDLNQVMRIDPDGTIRVVAGNGLRRFAGDGGSARAASLAFPTAVALDRQGNIFITDTSNQRIRKVDAAGIITTVAGGGTRPVGSDGLGTAMQLSAPFDLKFDSTGNLLFIERHPARLRRMTSGGMITTIAGDGTLGFGGDNGPATQAKFHALEGMTLDAADNIYLADTNNGRIRRVSPNGIVTTVAGGGNSTADGVRATEALLRQPSGVATGAQGNLYVADSYGHTVRRVDQGGIISTIAGTGVAGFSGDGGPARSARLSRPIAVAVDPFGIPLISDLENGRIRSVETNGVIRTIAGAGPFVGDGGSAQDARFSFIRGLALDTAGNLYIADDVANRVRRVTAGGLISTFAGTGRADSLVENVPSTTAPISGPASVAVDSQSNVYIADSNNFAIRKVTPAGVITNLVVHNPANGVPVIAPQDVAVDRQGNVYYTCEGAPQIYRVTPSGAATLFAGTGVRAHGGDGGPARSASFGHIRGLAIDAAGNVYFADSENHRVRRIDTAGIITTIAGNGDPGDSGDGGLATSARLVNPLGLAVTADGSLFVSSANRIRRISPNGVITAYAGTGSGGFSGDGGLAANATFNSAFSLVAAPNGDLYAGDVSNNRVRLILAAPGPSIILSQRGLSFRSVAGATTPPQSFTIVNGGQGVAGWSATASTTSGGNWLSATPATGSTEAGKPGSPVQVSVNASGLAAGDYYGQITVRSPAAANSPQTVTVVLTVGQATAGVDVQPSGLLFTATAAGTNPAAQTITVSTRGATVAVQSTASFGESRAFFTATPSSGNSTPALPLTITVQPSPAGLGPGIYTGTLTIAAADQPVKLVQVLFVVRAATPPAAAGRRTADGCTPARLLPLFTSLGGGFGVPAGYPSPIELRVVDDCGDPMTGGSVDVSFSNGDRALSLTSLRDGRWSGTWQSRSAESVPVTVTGRARSGELQGAAEVRGSLALSGNPPPAVASGGVLNAASYQLGASLAPGSLVSIFGLRLADSTESASALPLPSQLGSTRVVLAGRPLPLVFASPNQVNALVPYDLSVNALHQLVVRRGSALSIPEPVNILSTQSGVFTKNLTGQGEGIVVVAYGDGTQALAGKDNPVKAGDVLVLYCTGLGDVEPRAIAGSPIPVTPLSRVVEPVKVTIGGVPAPVAFAGLTPGFTGLYQINLVVPGGIPPGEQAPLVLSQGDRASPPVMIVVQ